MKRTLLMALAAACATATAAAQPPLRDPFARPAPPVRAEPSAPAEEAEARPRLRAVMYEAGHSLADIDGRIVARGEWIGSYRVVNVQERSVTLTRRGARIVLSLDQESNQ